MKSHGKGFILTGLFLSVFALILHFILPPIKNIFSLRCAVPALLFYGGIFLLLINKVQYYHLKQIHPSVIQGTLSVQRWILRFINKLGAIYAQTMSSIFPASTGKNVVSRQLLKLLVVTTNGFWSLCTRFALWIPIGVILWIVLNGFIDRVALEIQGIPDYDNYMYWAVGRGVLNGHKLYSEIMDIKPPGIFLLAAFSFWICNDFTVGLLYQGLSILFVGLVPLIFVVYLMARKLIQKDLVIPYVGLAVLLGVIQAETLSHLAGRFNNESLGAPFVCIYMLIVAMTRVSDTKFTITKIVVSVLSMAAAIGMKEPFLIAFLLVSLAFYKNPRFFVRSFVIPLTFALMLGASFLIFTDLILPYFKIYIPFLFSMRSVSHASNLFKSTIRPDYFSSFFERYSTFNDEFSYALLLFFCVSQMATYYYSKGKSSDVLKRIYLVFLIMFLTLYIAGIGQAHAWKNYGFCVPPLIALTLYSFWKTQIYFSAAWQRIVIVLFMVLAAFCFYKKKPDVMKDPVGYYHPKHVSEAAYIDSVMNVKGLDQYLMVGNGNARVYALTKHSPYGPNIIQSRHELRHPKALLFFENNLKRTELIVQDRKRTHELVQPKLHEYVNKYFTDQPWKEVRNISRVHPYFQIYFRKQTDSSETRESAKTETRAQKGQNDNTQNPHPTLLVWEADSIQTPKDVVLNTVNLDGNVTIEVLFKAENVQVEHATIFSNHPGSKSHCRGIALEIGTKTLSGTHPYTLFFGNEMNWNTVATFHLKASRWHHFVICKESRKYSWYIDGVKSGIKTMGSKISGSEFPMRIGNWYHGGRLFNGAIRKFKIYRGLLDESYIVHQWENVTQHTRE